MRRRHNLVRPVPIFANSSHGVVLDNETVEVESNEHIVRDSPGMARCVLCGNKFENTVRNRIKHTKSMRHQERLKEHDNK